MTKLSWHQSRQTWCLRLGILTRPTADGIRSADNHWNSVCYGFHCPDIFLEWRIGVPSYPITRIQRHVRYAFFIVYVVWTFGDMRQYGAIHTEYRLEEMIRYHEISLEFALSEESRVI